MSEKKLLVHVHFFIWFIFKIEFLSKIIEIISFLVSLLCTGQIVMNPSPRPPVPPWTSLFCCPGLLITLFVSCSTLINYSARSFFITHIFPLTSGLAWGIESEQLDRRIRCKKPVFLFKFPF